MQYLQSYFTNLRVFLKAKLFLNRPNPINVDAYLLVKLLLKV